MGNTELGSYLRLLRIKNNLTMTQTAGQTGITQGYISQIENGIYTPSARTLAKLARAYGVPEIHLLRKAGIVQLAGVSAPRAGTDDIAPSVDPLVEVSSTAELVELLKRGLAGLEYVTDQLRQRGQLASMPAADAEAGAAGGAELGAEILLPLYDASWQALTNAAGEPAAMRLPAYMCGDDSDAFVLAVADEAMAPLIGRGDWVVISPAAELVSGHVVAINDRNQIQLRRYMTINGMVSLMPLNPEYSAKALLIDQKKDKVEIVGRALRVVNRVL